MLGRHPRLFIGDFSIAGAQLRTYLSPSFVGG